MRTALLICGASALLATLVHAQLNPPAPNRPEEPVAAKLSLARAARFLDDAAITWTNERKCGSCHTNYAYLMARSSLRDVSPVPPEVRKFFEGRAENWEAAKPRWDTEVLATAATLAFDDAQTTGKLHPLTRKALDWMWKLQREDGSWNWLKCDWPPAESDDYYGVAFVAVGVGAAPENYAQSETAQRGLARIRQYLNTNKPANAHHRLMLLWASLKTGGLMTDADRALTIKELRALQRPDGGWSVRTLWGERKRHDGTMEDLSNPASDAYATGLVVYVLRQAGIPAGETALQRGLAWLKANQRESGRWFVRSLSTDRNHYLSHFGTAYAVMALKACE